MRTYHKIISLNNSESGFFQYLFMLNLFKQLYIYTRLLMNCESALMALMCVYSLVESLFLIQTVIKSSLQKFDKLYIFRRIIYILLI